MALRESGFSRSICSSVSQNRSLMITSVARGPRITQRRQPQADQWVLSLVIGECAAAAIRVQTLPSTNTEIDPNRSALSGKILDPTSPPTMSLPRWRPTLRAYAIRRQPARCDPCIRLCLADLTNLNAGGWCPMVLRYHGLIPSICEAQSNRDTQIEVDPINHQRWLMEAKDMSRHLLLSNKPIMTTITAQELYISATMGHTCPARPVQTVKHDFASEKVLTFFWPEAFLPLKQPTTDYRPAENENGRTKIGHRQKCYTYYLLDKHATC